MYSIEFRKAALRTLRKLNPEVQQRLRGAIALLAVDPRPPGARKLTGRDAWRLRIGDYRLIYTIEDARLLIVVVTMGHRSSVYRKQD